MVQFMKFGSIISHSLSLPGEIKMITSFRVVKVRISFKTRDGVIGTHLLI
jgi:hypothetical protein